VIDRADKKAMTALKKAISGYCGVYRWVHKQTIKTYTGGAKNLADRPFSHTATNSSNPQLKKLKLRDGNEGFYLVILWIAGPSSQVNSLFVYNVEMDYL
jgi:hypothetical protein